MGFYKRADHGAHESCPCLGEVCTEGCHKVRCTCQGGAGPLCRRGGMLKGVGNLTKDALTFKWAQATMKDVAVNTVVVTEIACWFFIGECIGKGSLVGYQV